MMMILVSITSLCYLTEQVVNRELQSLGFLVLFVILVLLLWGWGLFELHIMLGIG